MRYRINPHYLKGILTQKRYQGEQWMGYQPRNYLSSFFHPGTKHPMVVFVRKPHHPFNGVAQVKLHIASPGRPMNFLNDYAFIITFPQNT